MTYAPASGVLITNFKQQLKDILIGLFLDILDAESDYFVTTNPKDTPPSDKIHVRVGKSWPQTLSEVPTVAVGLQNMVLTKYNLNYGDIGGTVVDYEDYEVIRKMFCYQINGQYSVDVVGRTSDERDVLIEKLMESLMWGFGAGAGVPNMNTANIDVWQYFTDRFISLLPNEIRMVGETEMLLGSGPEVVYTDGFYIPLYSEMFSQTPPVGVLEDIVFHITGYNSQNE